MPLTKAKALNEADVNLLAYPLKEITDPKQVKKIWIITVCVCAQRRHTHISRRRVYFAVCKAGRQ